MSPSARNLPCELSSLVGRERELAEVERLLGQTRLLTLTGSGGCGKTRLAVAVAAEVVDGFAGGAWWVELASLSDSVLVPHVVASVLGVREQPGCGVVETLAGYLGARDVLLVLDNCEHLIEACAELAATLLRSCPGLRVLVTSRESLGIAGEVSWPVPSLSFPDSRLARAIESVARYDAVQLFVQRASAVQPTFLLSTENMAAVVQVCERLDGIPLALELAAGRTRVLAVQQIASRLDDCFRIVGSVGRAVLPRHRTLHATIEWSHDLLTEPERAVFRKLSVFAGGFALEAAEAVCAGEGVACDEVLDLVAHLVDKSLVLTRTGNGQVRYRLLETVGQYGRGRLADSGEDEAVRRRHAHWYLAFALEAESALKGSAQRRWLDLLEAEHDNLRAVLYWSEHEHGDRELGLRLATALWPFWVVRGHLSEGWRWLEGATSPSRVSALSRAKALEGAGSMAFYLGRYDTSKAAIEQGIVLCRELQNTDGLASALGKLGLGAVMQHRNDVNIPGLVEEGTRLRPQVRDPHAAARLLFFLAMGTGMVGDWTRAATLLEEAMALLRTIGDSIGLLSGLQLRSIVALINGEEERATVTLQECLTLAYDVDFKLILQYSYHGLGCLAASQGHVARAARLWGVTEAMGQAYGTSLMPRASSTMNYENLLASTRAQLGEDVFAATRAEGRSMSPEQARSYALACPATPDTAPARPVLVYPAGLSAREVQVLRLVAEGRSNAGVAVELFLSARTVNWHLSSIYRKLGCRSRTQAVRFALDHGIIEHSSPKPAPVKR